jgi:hypothetical protein
MRSLGKGFGWKGGPEAKGGGKGLKGSGKGYGYQGTCFKCGRVGHKAAECGWWVNEVDEMAKGEGGKEGDVGGLWVVAGVEEDGHRSKHDWNGGCCGGVAAAGPPRSRALPTLEAWMPKKVELGNRFEIFGIGEADEEIDEIGEVIEDEEEVEITIDSGAAKSVWPRKKKGVRR